MGEALGQAPQLKTLIMTLNMAHDWIDDGVMQDVIRNEGLEVIICRMQSREGLGPILWDRIQQWPEVSESRLQRLLRLVEVDTGVEGTN